MFCACVFLINCPQRIFSCTISKDLGVHIRLFLPIIKMYLFKHISISLSHTNFIIWITFILTWVSVYLTLNERVEGWSVIFYIGSNFSKILVVTIAHENQFWHKLSLINITFYYYLILPSCKHKRRADFFLMLLGKFEFVYGFTWFLTT